jgi:hypothetical protein
MNQDDIKIEILDNGDIKITTDPISGPNHMAAENLLKFLSQAAGGTTEQQRRGHGQAHSHGHIHHRH